MHASELLDDPVERLTESDFQSCLEFFVTCLPHLLEFDFALLTNRIQSLLDRQQLVRPESGSRRAGVLGSHVIGDGARRTLRGRAVGG